MRNNNHLQKNRVTIGAFVVDTVIALPKAVVQVLTPRRDSVKNRNAPKRFKANLMSDQGIMKIKHKYFAERVNYINILFSNYLSKIELEEASKIYSSGNLYRDVRLHHNPLVMTVDMDIILRQKVKQMQLKYVKCMPRM